MLFGTVSPPNIHKPALVPDHHRSTFMFSLQACVFTCVHVLSSAETVPHRIVRLSQYWSRAHTALKESLHCPPRIFSSHFVSGHSQQITTSSLIVSCSSFCTSECTRKCSPLTDAFDLPALACSGAWHLSQFASAHASGSCSILQNSALQDVACNGLTNPAPLD